MTFTNLTIDGQPVLFGEVCQWDGAIGAGHGDCQEPEPTSEPTVEPSETTDPGGTGGSDSLPETSGLTAAVILPIIGVLLLTAGTVAVVAGRRRRTVA